MTLHFELTQEDYLQYNYYYHTISPAAKRVRILNIFFPVFMLGCLLYLHGFDISDFGAFEYFLVLLSLFYISRILFYKAYLRLQIGRILKKDPNRFRTGPRELILDATKLTLVTSDTRNEMSWSSFTMLKENKEYLFLFLNGRQAIIIPKRIFLLEQELYDVQSFISEKLTLHKNDAL